MPRMTYLVMSFDMEADLLGAQLIEACLERNGSRVGSLVKEGAPLWYQEPDSGWTCLHVATNFGDRSLIKQLLDAGAIWNAGAVLDCLVESLVFSGY